MANKNLEELKEIRKQWFAKMEQELREMQPNEEDSLFYYHSSEDLFIVYAFVIDSCALGPAITVLKFSF